jgi:uncharacterized Fe-S cluster protein YjdI
MATSPDDNRLGRAYAAPEVTVFYDRSRCRHYAECVRGLPQVFDPARRPWIRADLADADTVAEVVRRCPPAPSTTACWQRSQRNRPIRPSSPLTPDPAPVHLVDLSDRPDGSGRLREQRGESQGPAKSQLAGQEQPDRLKWIL